MAGPALPGPQAECAAGDVPAGPACPEPGSAAGGVPKVPANVTHRSVLSVPAEKALERSPDFQTTSTKFAKGDQQSAIHTGPGGKPRVALQWPKLGEAVGGGRLCPNNRLLPGGHRLRRFCL